MSGQPTLSQPLGGPTAAASGRNLGVVPNDPGYKKVQDFQKKFMAEDGLMVWQKLPRDRMMYRASVALCAIGMGWTFYTMGQMAMPKKND